MAVVAHAMHDYFIREAIQPDHDRSRRLGPEKLIVTSNPVSEVRSNGHSQECPTERLFFAKERLDE